MTLTCTQSPLNKEGKPILPITVGKEYEATEIQEPARWEITGDDGSKTVFFNLAICFSQGLPEEIQKDWADFYREHACQSQ